MLVVDSDEQSASVLNTILLLEGFLPVWCRDRGLAEIILRGRASAIDVVVISDRTAAAAKLVRYVATKRSKVRTVLVSSDPHPASRQPAANALLRRPLDVSLFIDTLRDLSLTSKRRPLRAVSDVSAPLPQNDRATP